MQKGEKEFAALLYFFITFCAQRDNVEIEKNSKEFFATPQKVEKM